MPEGGVYGAAAGLALINTAGNLGGCGGPFIFGWFRDLTGGTATGLYAIAGICVLAAVLAWRTKNWTTAPPSDPASRLTDRGRPQMSVMASDVHPDQEPHPKGARTHRRTHEPMEHRNVAWHQLTGRLVEVCFKGQLYCTGLVDANMPDSTGLWLAQDGISSREYINRS